MRIELKTSTGRWSTLVDRVRQLDHGGWQLSELKSNWAGFATDRARVQASLGTLAADALGAEYVREVPATLMSALQRELMAAVAGERDIAVDRVCRSLDGESAAVKSWRDGGTAAACPTS